MNSNACDTIPSNDEASPITSACDLMSASSNNSTSDFLNALIGSYEGPVAYLLDGERIETADPTFPTQHECQLRLFPDCQGSVFFV